MPVQSAIDFIVKASNDSNFRDEYYMVESNMVFEKVKSDGFRFTMTEFEEAKYILLFKAQTETQAMKIKEMAMWFYMINNYTTENPLYG